MSLVIQNQQRVAVGTLLNQSEPITALLLGSTLYIRSLFDDNLDVVEKTWIDNTNNGIFNFHSTFLIAKNTVDSVVNYEAGTLIKTNTDDICPASTVNITFIGANHGYLAAELTVPSHDKTAEDLGSLWRGNNGTENFWWYLIKIVSETKLQFIRQSKVSVDTWNITNSSAATTPLAHVSGATNIANIVVSSKASIQARPICNNKSVQFLKNGTTALVDGVFTSCNYVDVVDIYDVLDPNTTGDGTEKPAKITVGTNSWDYGAKWWENEITYRFMQYGVCLINAKRNFSRPIKFSYDGYNQADKLLTVGTYTQRMAYMPKVKAIAGTNAINITAATAANPIVITATSHGLMANEYSKIDGIVGDIGDLLNGITHAITYISSSQFSIALNGTGKTYTSGGTSTKINDYKAITNAVYMPAIIQNFEAATVDDITNPPDRFLQFLATADMSKKIGFANGYVTDRHLGSKANRAANATRWWQLSTSMKSYPHAIHSGSANFASVISTPTEFECTSYRAFFDAAKISGVTSLYFVQLTDCTMLYIDAHAECTNKEIQLPAILKNKAIEIIDSETATITETNSGIGLIHFTTTGNYGFVTAKMT